jgi:chemotaxis protein MotB
MSATGEARPIIIIKKKKVIAGGGHHGGAWKVAYADFVTAMMAFFLLMWLLNATSEDQRKGLADYFNPTLPISRTSAGGAGMLEGKAIFGDESTAGTVPDGVPPKPTHQEDGSPLGSEDEVPDLPPDVAPGEFASNAGAGMGAEVDAGKAGNEGSDGEGSDREGSDDLESGDLELGSLGPGEAEARAEQARLEAVSRQVAEAMRKAEDGALERHFFLRITPDGLVIEIIDADDQPLFASASAVPAPILPLLIDILVPVLDEITNDIAVVGHTDAVQFGSADYSNWELSADRANAARRLLTERGLAEGRIARVTGKAAVEPLVADPNAAQNRRIAITLLRNPSR